MRNRSHGLASRAVPNAGRQPLSDSQIRRHALGLLLVAAAAAAVAFPYASSVRTNLSPARMLVASEPAEQFRRAVEKEFGSEWNSFALIFESEGELITANRLNAFRNLGFAIEGLDNVVRVLHPSNVETAVGYENVVEIRKVFYPVPDAPQLEERLRYATAHPLLRRRLLSEDGSVAAVVVDIEDGAQTRVAPLLASIERLIDAEPEFRSLRVYRTGFPAIEVESSNLVVASQAYLLPSAALIIAGGLLFAFRALVGVYPAFVSMCLAMIWTYALMERLGIEISMLGTMIPVVILTIGASQAIYLIDAFATARAGGASRGKAIRTMLGTAGVGCLGAALTTSVGFYSLSTSTVSIVAEYGVACCLAVLCVLLANLLVVPATLMLHRTSPRPLAGSNGKLGRLLGRTGDWSQRNRRKLLVATGAVMLASGILSTRIENNVFYKGEVDSGHPIEKAIVVADEQLSGIGGVVVGLRARNGALLDPQVLAAISRLQGWLESLPEVRRTLSFVDYLKDANHAFSGGRLGYEQTPGSRALAEQLLFVAKSGDTNGEFDRLLSDDQSWALVRVSTGDIGDRAYVDLERTIQNRLREAPLPEGIETEIGAGSLVWAKAEFRTVQELGGSFMLAFVVIFSVMLLLVRSVRLAALAVVPNVVPTAVCLALMATSGIMMRLGTAVCFTVALGIAVDDTIHFLMKYKSYRRESPSVESAIRRTITDVGPAMLLTAFVLVAGFAVYTFAPFRTLSELAVLIAVALGTAVLAEFALTPALIATFAETSPSPVLHPVGSTTSEAST